MQDQGIAAEMGQNITAKGPGYDIYDYQSEQINFYRTLVDRCVNEKLGAVGQVLDI